MKGTVPEKKRLTRHPVLVKGIIEAVGYGSDIQNK